LVLSIADNYPEPKKLELDNLVKNHIPPLQEAYKSSIKVCFFLESLPEVVTSSSDWVEKLTFTVEPGIYIVHYNTNVVWLGPQPKGTVGLRLFSNPNALIELSQVFEKNTVTNPCGFRSFNFLDHTTLSFQWCCKTNGSTALRNTSLLLMLT